jgi:RES domain-containing protein
MAALPSPTPQTRMWHLPHAEAVVAVGEILVGLPRIIVRRTVYRAMLEIFLHPLSGATPEPLHYLGSLAGGRYTPRGGPAGLYASFDPATPIAELRAVVFTEGVPTATADHMPIVSLAVHCDVRRILDVTADDICAPLDLHPADLAADWQSGQEVYLRGEGPMPATQLLALAAHETAIFAGITYPSARTDFGTNLVIFPDRLNGPEGDRLEVIDPSGRYSQRLPV